jgi:putative flavoprotein involved in K+ transport
MRPDGGYLATVDEETISCDNVVVASGTFGRTPNVPGFAAELDASTHQLHSSQYRRPAQLQPGPVLVVGASHSGLDIAYELAETRPTILCGPSRGTIPFRPESRRAHLLMPLVVFAFQHVLTRRTPMGRKEMHDVRLHGGPAFRIKQADLDRRGVVRNQARLTGVAEL